MDTQGMADKRKKTIKQTVAPMRLVRDVTTEDIAAKAYELYRARDGEHGHDVEDWLAAEAEVDQLLAGGIASPCDCN